MFRYHARIAALSAELDAIAADNPVLCSAELGALYKLAVDALALRLQNPLSGLSCSKCFEPVNDANPVCHCGKVTLDGAQARNRERGYPYGQQHRNAGARHRVWTETAKVALEPVDKADLG